MKKFLAGKVSLQDSLRREFPQIALGTSFGPAQQDIEQLYSEVSDGDKPTSV